MKISEQSIQAAKEVPLFDIIQHYVILKPNRSGYIGLCPFHKERTPSFSVKPGICYKCFGCDAKGNNPVDFVMKHDRKNFVEAVVEVLTLSGIQVIESDGLYQKQIPVIKKTITAKRTSTFSLIPKDLFIKSIQMDQDVVQIAKTNRFVKYLINLFGPDITKSLVNKYFIGTSKHKFKAKDFPSYESISGATIFWQMDFQGNLRTGKIMLYDATRGKRIRKPFDHITWVHFLLKQPDFRLKRCLFGEHLLTDQSRPIALVESEKTAIISSVYLPQFTWLAVGGKDYLNYEICQILKGRSIVLFPDTNCYDSWTKKAKEFSDIGFFQVSDLLYLNATEAERKQGLDLVDYLIKFDHREFNKSWETKDQEHNNENVGPVKLQIENNNSRNISSSNFETESDYPAFIDYTGRLFIKPPSCKDFTVYQSVSDYNDRKGYPTFKSKNEMHLESMKRVNINLNSLKIDY